MANRIHGQHGTPTYRAWRGMFDRCENPNDHGYKRYGARGIRVCNRWRSFECFWKDMGTRPQGLTLGRIDNNGPYCPENCQWETPLQQANNKRNNNLVSFSGITLSVSQWSRRLGIRRITIERRKARSLSVDKILSTFDLRRPSARVRLNLNKPTV